MVDLGHLGPFRANEGVNQLMEDFSLSLSLSHSPSFSVFTSIFLCDSAFQVNKTNLGKDEPIKGLQNICGKI